MPNLEIDGKKNMEKEEMQTPENGTQQEGTPAKVPTVQGTFEEVPQTPKPEPTEVDYRNKFANSTRENQVIAGEMRALQETLGEITKEDIPTEQELQTLYPDWDLLSDFEKQMGRKQEAGQRQLKRVHAQVSTVVNKSELANRLNAEITSNPLLSGKEVAFTEYASKRPNVPTDVLANAFLFEVKEAPVKPIKRQNSILESGTYSEEPVTANKKMSDEESQKLRLSDPKRYNDMLMNGEL